MDYYQDLKQYHTPLDKANLAFHARTDNPGRNLVGKRVEKVIIGYEFFTDIFLDGDMPALTTLNGLPRGARVVDVDARSTTSCMIVVYFEHPSFLPVPPTAVVPERYIQFRARTQ